MRILHLSLVATIAALSLFAQQPLPSAASAANEELFETRIRPLFANNCYACHTDEHMGGLQLDTAEHLRKGGKSGPVIVPGDPGNSLIVKALHYNDTRLKMPPTGRLKDSEIADVETWIKNGAVWPQTSAKSTAPAPHSAPYTITAEQRAFWSFLPIVKPAPPAVHDTKWGRTEIDRFLLAKLEEHNLKPVPPASKRSLLRRASYDLTGLPPTPAEVAAFERDKSPTAFARVIDRLLESPRYGEKWGRFWLDIARYSDDRLNSERDDPYENSFRYRDWVIQSVQQDMPYNLFVKAQIAGDLLPQHELYEAGLGFYSLSPEFSDDRVDATTRGFMALTVACATCHNHKYDPIPTQDFYSLLGIFNNTDLHETPIAPKEEVERYEAQKKLLDTQETEIKDYISRQSTELADILAQDTAAYMLAFGKTDPSLDKETLGRITKYLAAADHKHPFLKAWNKDKSPQAAQDFQKLLLDVDKEKKHIDDENHVRLGLNPTRDQLSDANLLSMPRDRYVLWEDFFGDKGIYHYGEGTIDRFLTGVWKAHLDSLHARQAELKKQLPPHYPYLQTIADKPKLEEAHVWLRGNKDSPGEPAPPHFLSILSQGPPPRFTHGNGRLDLAEAIVDPKNPLTPRVIVNRIWQQHFGQGIVRTPSNFGKQGDTPSHPELLDYLATRFMAEGWSLKKLHREMMLTSAYALSTENNETDYAADPENRLLWRSNRRRLDVESLRDSLLFVAGDLDLKAGGPATEFGPTNHRRTVYGFISRRRLDPVLALFDFPNPIATSEQRLPTLVPLQKLFFMNSDFVMEQSKALAEKLQETTGSDNARIAAAYRLLFQRDPTPAERKLALDFLRDSQGSWPQYAQVLLSSNEFSYLN